MARWTDFSSAWEALHVLNTCQIFELLVSVLYYGNVVGTYHMKAFETEVIRAVLPEYSVAQDPIGEN